MNGSLNRRDSLTALSLLVMGLSQGHAIEPRFRNLVATNTYPWQRFFKRSKAEFKIHSDELLKSIASTGIKGYEPIVDSVESLDGLSNRLRNYGLTMKSIYVNSVLHDRTKSSASIDKVIAIAEAVRKMGTEIIVTNPSPIRWGGKEDKTDVQLRNQARALDQLGAKLRKIGIKLAYHNHDAELRQGGREFHHMLTATDPENVKLCLDSHWIYRGCGNSEVAVMDALTHYHERVVELHLRQSNRGAWTEVFDVQGDIDYLKILDFLHRKKITPFLVLEQAVEEESPNSLSSRDAHQKSFQRLSKHV